MEPWHFSHGELSDFWTPLEEDWLQWSHGILAMESIVFQTVDFDEPCFNGAMAF